MDLAGAGLGRPHRQQTLRQTIQWSHTLLPPDLQRVFRQLAVFSGDFDLDAMAAVNDVPADPLDSVAELVDGSLAAVGTGPDGEPRIRLLRTIAAFARERLDDDDNDNDNDGEADEARRRHARHYLTLAEAAGPRLRTRQHLSARDWFELELDNLRAALAWSLQPNGSDDGIRTDDLTIGLRLCGALSWFWYACGYQSEGRGWLSAASVRASGQDSSAVMTALHGLGVLLRQQGDLDGSRAALERCLDYWTRIGNRAQVAAELSSLAAVHRARGDNDLARTMLADGIAAAREAGIAPAWPTACPTWRCSISTSAPRRRLRCSTRRWTWTGNWATRGGSRAITPTWLMRCIEPAASPTPIDTSARTRRRRWPSATSS
ncbi:MAG: tetratricopeptide repeat protein [Geodermatophilaceae bacterium]